MKVKKINRYYCEHCKKSGCSGYWMKRHEQRCTMNPNRECGYCNLLEQTQPKISDLLVILPDINNYVIIVDVGEGDYDWENIAVEVERAMPQLRELSGNCPACIMSALRQKGIPVPIVSSFNFTNECKAIWDDINSAKTERENWDL